MHELVNNIYVISLHTYNEVSTSQCLNLSIKEHNRKPDNNIDY